MAGKDFNLDIVVGLKDKIKGGFDRIKKNLKSLADTAAKAFVSVTAIGTATFGAGLASFFTSSTRAAADFEQQMATVAAVSGATGDDLKALEDAAKEMGATTQFSAVQAAEALEVLSRAGLSSSDAIATLPVVLNTAAAANIDLAESANIITAATQGMGLAFSEAGRVADVLSKAASSSATSVGEAGRALAEVGPVAAASGIEIEQVVAGIGQLANAGIQGSKAGTALKGILIQLQNPASKASKELASLGISTRDLQGLLTGLGKAGSAGERAILSFGTEAGPALRALLAQGEDALQGLTGALENSTGEAERQAAVMQNTLQGAFAGLSSAWEALKINLGQTAALQPITDAVQAITTRLQELASGEEFRNFAEQIGQTLGDLSRSAIQFVKDFDFKAALDSAASFAKRTGEAVSVVLDNLDKLGNATDVVLGGVRAAWSGLNAAVTAAASAITRAFAGLFGAFASIQEAALQLGIGSQETALKMRNLATTADAMADSFARAAGEGLAGVVDGLEQVAGNAGDAESGMAGAAEAAGDLAEAADDTARSLDSVADVDLTQLQRTVSTTAAQLLVAREATRQAEFALLDLERSGTASADQVRDAVQTLADAQIAERRATDESVAARDRFRAAAEKPIESNQAQLRQDIEQTAAGYKAAEKQVAEFAGRTVENAELQQLANRNVIETTQEVKDKIAEMRAEREKEAAEAVSGGRAKLQIIGEEQAAVEDLTNSNAELAAAQAQARQEQGKALNQNRETIAQVKTQIRGLIEDEQTYREIISATNADIYNRKSATGELIGETQIWIDTLERLKRAQEEQRAELEGWTSALGELEGTALAKVIEEAEAAAGSFSRLNEADLSKLSDSILAAKERLLDFRREVDGLVDDIDNRLAELEGRELDILAGEQARELAELEEALARATNPEDVQRLQKARQDLIRIYDIERQKILDQIAAEQGQEAAREAARSAEQEYARERAENARLARQETQLQIESYKQFASVLERADVTARDLYANLSAIAAIDFSSASASWSDFYENMKQSRSVQ